MCAAGVFLLRVFGVVWLFPNGCARTYLILLVSEVGILWSADLCVFVLQLQTPQVWLDYKKQGRD